MSAATVASNAPANSASLAELRQSLVENVALMRLGIAATRPIAVSNAAPKSPPPAAPQPKPAAPTGRHVDLHA